MGNPSRRADSPGRPHKNLSRWPAFPRSPRMALEVGGRSPRVLPLGVLALEHTPQHPPRLTAQAPAGRCVPGLQGVSGPGPTWRGTEPASLSLCLMADALCSHPGFLGAPTFPFAPGSCASPRTWPPPALAQPQHPPPGPCLHLKLLETPTLPVAYLPAAPPTGPPRGPGASAPQWPLLASPYGLHTSGPSCPSAFIPALA